MRNTYQRLLKHLFAKRWQHYLSEAALQRITRAIGESERTHTGEIRVCLEARLPGSYLKRPDDMASITRQRALTKFSKLRVWDTAENNGVLIYLLLAERTIEVVADRGIDARVQAQQWQNLVHSLAGQLQRGAFEEGLLDAVHEVTRLLQAHFPTIPGQPTPNELPDRPDAS
jgi:uncharacterized membrane protein